MFFLLICGVLCSVFVFFFKQKTAYEMRISDWSSDVCSSVLLVALYREDVVVVATVVVPYDLGARLDLDLLRTEGVVDRADPDLDALHQRRRRRALVQGAAVAGVVGAVVAAGTEEGDGRDDAERSDPALHDSRAPGSAGTSTAFSCRAVSGTMSSTFTLVEASTTGAGTPSL